jgi:plasmid stability protein
MSAHAITLHLPETLYQRFRQRAEWTHRSLETELLDAVAASVSVEEEEISPELLRAIEALETLDDDKLWLLASAAVPPEASEELASLHLKMRDERLSPEEDAARARLMQEYERSMLIRAQAAKLLKDRGRDISKLLLSPSS